MVRVDLRIDAVKRTACFLPVNSLEYVLPVHNPRCFLIDLTASAEDVVIDVDIAIAGKPTV